MKINVTITFKKKPKLWYETDDAITMIKDRTGLSNNDIVSVLEAEEYYMASVGIMEEPGYWDDYYE